MHWIDRINVSDACEWRMPAAAAAVSGSAPALASAAGW